MSDATDSADPARRPLNDHLCWLLTRASHSLTTELAAALEGLGLSPRAHEVLVTARDGNRSQIEIARAVGLDKTTMVVTLDELERAGLAERRPSPRDRRARVVAVTEAGERLLRQADEIIRDVHAEVLSTLPEGEREAFFGSLQRLVAGRLAEPAATPRPARRRAGRATARAE